MQKDRQNRYQKDDYQQARYLNRGQLVDSTIDALFLCVAHDDPYP
jgi:hypothetical protein